MQFLLRHVVATENRTTEAENNRHKRASEPGAGCDL